MKTLCIKFTPKGAENYVRHLQLQTCLSPLSSAQHFERESTGKRVIVRRGEPEREDPTKDLIHLRVPEDAHSGRYPSLHNLLFVCAIKDTCLLVLNTYRSNSAAACRSTEEELKVAISADDWADDLLTGDDFTRLVQHLRDPGEQARFVEEALADWRAYLDVELYNHERTSFEGKYSRFDLVSRAFRHGQKARDIAVFSLSTYEEHSFHNLRQNTEVYAGELRRPLGLVTDVISGRCEVHVDLAPEVRVQDIPREGTLRNRSGAGLISVHRQQDAIQRLQNGDALLEGRIGLEEVVFGNTSTLQFPPLDTSQRITQAECLLQQINEDQLEAVNSCVNTPDVFLLQGPPGTGKTTFIAELCYHAALQGQRVLVASQANLAVDNALSRLDRSERILCVRDRNPEDLGDNDDDSFIGDKAVHRWLEGVLTRVEGNVASMNSALQGLDRVANTREAFEQYDQAARAADQLPEQERSAKEAVREAQRAYDEAQLATTEAEQVLASIVESVALPATTVPPTTRAVEEVHASSNVLLERAAALTAPALLSSTAAVALSAWQDSVGANPCPWASVQALGATSRQLHMDWLEEWPRESHDPVSDLAHTLQAQVLSTSSVAQALDATRHTLTEAHARLADLTTTLSAIRAVADGREPLVSCANLEEADTAVGDLVEFANRLHGRWWTETKESIAEVSSRDDWEDDRDTALHALSTGDMPTVTSALRQLSEQWGAVNGYLRKASVIARWGWRRKKRRLTKTCNELSSRGRKLILELRIHNLAGDGSKIASQVTGATARLQGHIDATGVTIDDAESRIEELQLQLECAEEETREASSALAQAIDASRYHAPPNGTPISVEAADQLVSGLQEITVLGRAIRTLHADLEAQVDASSTLASELSGSTAKDAVAAEKHLAAQTAEAERLHHEAAAAAKTATQLKVLAIDAVNTLQPPNSRAVRSEDEARQRLHDLHSEARQAFGEDPERVQAKRDIASDWASELTHARTAKIESIRTVFDRMANVIGATCTRSGAKSFVRRHGEFDLVIVDEVSKATPTELLIPLILGKKIVLVGDHKQLGPTVMLNRKSEPELSFEEALAEVSESGKQPFDLARLEANVRRNLFKDLFEVYERNEPSRCMTLRLQYRMHSQIMEVVNSIYDGHLRLGSPDQDARTQHTATDVPWLQKGRSVYWVDTRSGGNDYREEELSPGKRNAGEAQLIANSIVPALMSNSDEEVGVISFYRAQVEDIRRRLRSQDIEPGRVDVRSVDNFQGSERNAIVLSMVATHRPTLWLRTIERINVAVSRAQRLLIVVGNPEPFMKVEDPEVRRLYRALHDRAVHVPVHEVIHS